MTALRSAYDLAVDHPVLAAAGAVALFALLGRKTLAWSAAVACGFWLWAVTRFPLVPAVALSVLVALVVVVVSTEVDGRRTG